MSAADHLAFLRDRYDRIDRFERDFGTLRIDVGVYPFTITYVKGQSQRPWTYEISVGEWSHVPSSTHRTPEEVVSAAEETLLKMTGEMIEELPPGGTQSDYEISKDVTSVSDGVGLDVTTTYYLEEKDATYVITEDQMDALAGLAKVLGRKVDSPEESDKVT